MITKPEEVFSGESLWVLFKPSLYRGSVITKPAENYDEEFIKSLSITLILLLAYNMPHKKACQYMTNLENGAWGDDPTRGKKFDLHATHLYQI